MMTTVHVLRSGLPFCGFSAELPRHWPRGNTWCSISELDYYVLRDAVREFAGIPMPELEGPERRLIRKMQALAEMEGCLYEQPCQTCFGLAREFVLAEVT